MQIIDIFDENKQLQELSFDKLPLEIYRPIQKNHTLFIAPLIQENTDQEKTVYGYIAHEDNHLFFQPDETNNQHHLFHNNEIIEKSVWLKSGDILQFEQQIITYNVSGDKIELSIMNKPEQPVTLNPLHKEKVEAINPSNHSLSQNHNTNAVGSIDEPTTSHKIKYFILWSLFTLLMIMAVFILLAKRAEIIISPPADTIRLEGIFPVIQVDNQYILIAGQYVLKADKQGYRTLETNLEINDNNKQFLFSLKENPGLVQFKITPEDHNEIFIDDILLDQKDQDSYEIDKGEHRLSIINPRYKKYQQTIKIEGKNKQQNYTINLQPNWGLVTLNVLQEDTQINITKNNDSHDQAYHKLLNRMDSIELIAGEYHIDASKEKYKSSRQTLIVNAGDQIIIKPFDLEFKEGILKLTSQPKQSIIRIDGQYFGKTPQSIKLTPYKKHYIELSLSGHKTIKKTMSLEPDILLESHLLLTSNSGIVFISSTPKQAQLSIDGVKQKNNSGKFTLKTGKHHVKVHAKGYKTQQKTLNIDNQSKNISFVLQKNRLQQKTNHNTSRKQAIKNNRTSNYTNTLGQQMIYIRPTTFMMGSKRSESGRNSNEQQHKVNITQAYFLSSKEVTNQQFKQFKRSHHSGSSAGLSLDSAQQPVVNVSWQEAVQFANWLSKKESLTPYYQKSNGQFIAITNSSKSNGYRLPFEAEWAWVARANKHRKYPWHGRYPPVQVHANYADISAVSYITNTLLAYNDHFSVSAPVGSYAKNALGFYDMAGNVSEWCHDYYSPTFGISGTQTSIDPMGPKRGNHHIVRDASWRDASITALRLSYRSYSKKKSHDIGFRLARGTQ